MTDVCFNDFGDVRQLNLPYPHLSIIDYSFFCHTHTHSAIYEKYIAFETFHDACFLRTIVIMVG